MKLNLGCGRDVREGWVNVDSWPFDGAFVVDLDSGDADAIEAELLAVLDGGSADELLLSHVIEHMRNPLPMMEAIWRVSDPDATLIIRTPHGASDDADEDPTHVRRMLPGSFGYFSQPFYWRADYGYRGDWAPIEITLAMDDAIRRRYQGDWASINHLLSTGRNVVQEMVAELRAVKPARAPERELQDPPELIIEWRT